jgi:hypothetical protein
MSNDSHSSPAWRSGTHRGRTSLGCAAQSTDRQRNHSRPPRCQSDSAAGESHPCVPGDEARSVIVLSGQLSLRGRCQTKLLIKSCRISRDEKPQKGVASREVFNLSSSRLSDARAFQYLAVVGRPAVGARTELGQATILPLLGYPVLPTAPPICPPAGDASSPIPLFR